jgi:hypothetical protein
MVSDGCGDCARRLPQKTKAQTKMQTKRAIMTLNLRETSEHALAALEAAERGFSWPVPRLRLSWVERSGEVVLAGPELGGEPSVPARPSTAYSSRDHRTSLWRRRLRIA